MLFGLVNLGMLLSPRYGWPDPFHRFNNSKILPLSYLWCQAACIHSRCAVRAVARQVRSKIRGLLHLLCLWSLTKTVMQVYAPTSNTEEPKVKQFYEDAQDLLELTPKRDILFIIGDWNAKIGSQEIPWVTDKFGLGVQNKTGQRLTEFCQENALVIANTLFQNIRGDSTHEHHQMVNT